MRVPQRTQPRLDQAPWTAATVAAIVGLTLAMLLFAPAAWLAHVVHWGTQGRVVLAQAEGSVWNGSARMVLTAGAGASDASSLPGRIQWTLRPHWVGVKLQLDAPCCSRETAQAVLRWAGSGPQLDFSSVQLDLPAQWLSGLGAPWNTLVLQGQVALKISSMQVQWLAQRTRLQGEATADLMGISSRLSTLAPLGDYRLTLSGGDVPRLNVQTLEGALQLSGSGQWVGSRMRFNGEATAEAQHQDALNNVLNIIGRRQGAKSMISIG
jgi:general secretion pathway protein N